MPTTTAKIQWTPDMNIRRDQFSRLWILSVLLCFAVSLSAGCGNDGGSSGTYWTADWLGAASYTPPQCPEKPIQGFCDRRSDLSIELLLAQTGSEVLGTMQVSNSSGQNFCVGSGSVSAIASDHDLSGVGTIERPNGTSASQVYPFSFTIRGETRENGEKVAVGTYECGSLIGNGANYEDAVELTAVF